MGFEGVGALRWVGVEKIIFHTVDTYIIQYSLLFWSSDFVYSRRPFGKMVGIIFNLGRLRSVGGQIGLGWGQIGLDVVRLDVVRLDVVRLDVVRLDWVMSN